jgi:hypothetical protein
MTLSASYQGVCPCCVLARVNADEDFFSGKYDNLAFDYDFVHDKVRMLVNRRMVIVLFNVEVEKDLRCNLFGEVVANRTLENYDESIWEAYVTETLRGGGKWICAAFEVVYESATEILNQSSS